MASTDKWDRRYAAAEMPAPACTILREQAERLPASGRALDLACGLGGNAVFLARRGFQCGAWDTSEQAIARLDDYSRKQSLNILGACRDVEVEPPPPKSFDVIVVSFFLYRPILPALAAALRPGGLLYYQTFVETAGATGGPRNPAFLLQPGELGAAFAQLNKCYYEERPDPRRATIALFCGAAPS